MARIFTPHTFLRTAVTLALAGILAACGSNTQATPPATTQPVISAPTSVPTLAPTIAPTAEPTAEPTPAPTSQTFSSAKIPIELVYPSGWNAVDFGEREAASYVGLPEQSMEITAPGSEARLIVRYYDYGGPGSGDATGAYMAIQFNESIDRTTVSETTDNAGNIDAEWTYIDEGTGEPVHALARFIHNEGSSYSYALLFQAPEEQFAELAPIGEAMLASFQER